MRNVPTLFNYSPGGIKVFSNHEITPHHVVLRRTHHRRAVLPTLLVSITLARQYTTHGVSGSASSL